MISMNNIIRNRRLNELRTNLKQASLITNLAKKLTTNNQNSISVSSIQDQKYDYQKQTNSTPSEINAVPSSIRNQLTDNSFDEKYLLFEKIGQGANGCVYRCQHKINKKIYAVKKFKVSEEQIIQIKRNFIQIEQLSHESICSYKALYFDSNQRFAFLVMDYFPHPNLQEYAIQSEQELKIVIRQLISAIGYLHKHHICHRDIKPENILYDFVNKKIKIIDFGISKKIFQRGVKRDMLTIIGTNFYFAPQIYLGGGYDQRVDLWALGVTVYKLIAGYTPFESKYHSDSIANILKGEISFDNKLWSIYSPFAKDFVTRILKPRNQRMSLNQCQMHFWLQYVQIKAKNLRRWSSLDISNKQESINRPCERSKEEIFEKDNSPLSLNKKGILKKIKSLNVNQFDLQECDQTLSQIKIVNRRSRRMTL